MKYNLFLILTILMGTTLKASNDDKILIADIKCYTPLPKYFKLEWPNPLWAAADIAIDPDGDLFNEVDLALQNSYLSPVIQFINDSLKATNSPILPFTDKDIDCSLIAIYAVQPDGRHYLEFGKDTEETSYNDAIDKYELTDKAFQVNISIQLSPKRKALEDARHEAAKLAQQLAQAQQRLADAQAQYGAE